MTRNPISLICAGVVAAVLLTEPALAHREYVAGLQRFAQRDPLSARDGRNLYGYAKERPIVILDPKGLYAQNANTDCMLNCCGPGGCNTPGAFGVCWEQCFGMLPPGGGAPPDGGPCLLNCCSSTDCRNPTEYALCWMSCYGGLPPVPPQPPQPPPPQPPSPPGSILPGRGANQVDWGAKFGIGLSCTAACMLICSATGPIAPTCIYPCIAACIALGW